MVWASLMLLGAYHGLNPAMGWLFAVSFGMQERRTAAVFRALVPITLGHAASVAVVVVIVGGARLVVPWPVLKALAACVLFGFAGFLVVRRFAHPRWVGMRVGFRDLVLWSFLMSSAHGAGLMLLPAIFFLSPGPADPHAGHLPEAAPWSASLVSGVGAVGVHTVTMFAAMTVAAVVVFRFVGLEVLRRSWINLDTVWVAALLVAGIGVLLSL
jgi:hypothetical protein